MASDKRLLNVLFAINSITNNNRFDFGEKLQHILLEIVGFMGAKNGSIMLVKGKKGLEVCASTDAGLIGVTQPPDDASPAYWVLENGRPLYIDDISRSDIFRKRFDKYEGGAFLLMPVTGDNKTIGVLSVTDKVGEDTFSREEQEALLNIVGQFISALENQRMAESLERKKRALQQKNLQLRKSERLKTDLFNMMVHDLKGPISDLIANLDVLSYTVSEEDREYVESSKSGCDLLYSMVSNLLDLGQLDEGKLKLVYEKIDPQDLISEAETRLSGLGKAKDLAFIENFTQTKTEDFLWGDRRILLRVIQNLLINAINYSPTGERVEVGFHYLKSQKIEVFVSDNGPGVLPEHQKNIFDKYFQLEKRHEIRVYSTGLGLTFCKMAVKAHGGGIGVKSNGRKGSLFSFTLPLGKKEQPARVSSRGG